MRRGLVLAAFFLFFLMSQGIFRHFPTVSFRIDGFWLLVLFMGFYVPTFPGLLWVFTMGLVQESLGAPFHGAIVSTFLLIYLFLRLTHGHLFVYGRLAQMVWVFFLSLGYKVIETTLLRSQGYEHVPLPILWVVISSLLQGAISLALFPWLQNLIGKQTSHDYVS